MMQGFFDWINFKSVVWYFCITLPSGPINRLLRRRPPAVAHWALAPHRPLEKTSSHRLRRRCSMAVVTRPLHRPVTTFRRPRWIPCTIIISIRRRGSVPVVRHLRRPLRPRDTLLRQDHRNRRCHHPGKRVRKRAERECRRRFKSAIRWWTSGVLCWRLFKAVSDGALLNGNSRQTQGFISHLFIDWLIDEMDSISDCSINWSIDLSIFLLIDRLIDTLIDQTISR